MSNASEHSQAPDKIAGFDPSVLKRQLRQAESRKRMMALGLVLPLFLFVFIFFAAPMGGLLSRAAHSPEVTDHFTRTVEVINQTGQGVFDEPFYQALFEDVVENQKNRTIGKVARRLNQDQTGYISALKRAARKAKRVKETPPSYKEWFIGIDERWGDKNFLAALERASSSTTDLYLLQALDLERSPAGDIQAVDADKALFVDVLLRTLWISFMVTMICIALGYPLAWVLANSPKRWQGILLVGVLFPFWTSLLVRTAAWIIVLQQEGPVNGFLQWIMIIDEPLQLVFNRFGVYVALTHILLPFLVLPLYSVMVSIPKDYMRAAKSLGAHPIRAFFDVYVPQTIPGLGAGAILVFILSIGYYITPALVGGPKDQMISYFIAFYTNNTINWGLAAALALNLLIVTLVLYAFYQRLSGDRNTGLGGK